MRLSVVCDESKASPIDGSATFATARFRFATAATRINAMRTRPCRAGAVEVSGGRSPSAMRARAYGSAQPDRTARHQFTWARSHHAAWPADALAIPRRRELGIDRVGERRLGRAVEPGQLALDRGHVLRQHR